MVVHCLPQAASNIEQNNTNELKTSFHLIRSSFRLSPKPGERPFHFSYTISPPLPRSQPRPPAGASLPIRSQPHGAKKYFRHAMNRGLLPILRMSPHRTTAAMHAHKELHLAPLEISSSFRKQRFTVSLLSDKRSTDCCARSASSAGPDTDLEQFAFEANDSDHPRSPYLFEDPRRRQTAYALMLDWRQRKHFSGAIDAGVSQGSVALLAGIPGARLESPGESCSIVSS